LSAGHLPHALAYLDPSARIWFADDGFDGAGERNAPKISAYRVAPETGAKTVPSSEAS
jgi:hypothetical protein